MATKDVAFDMSQVLVQPFMRPREGAQKKLDGTYAEEDTEIGVAFCVGCVSSAPILDQVGQRRGVGVPIIIFTKSASEVREMGAKLLGIADEPGEHHGLVAV